MNAGTRASQVGSLSPPALARAQRVRSDLRTIIVAWVFGAVWLWTVTGATLTQFARAVGTPDWAFGVLAALPFVGTLFQLPAGYAVDRWGFRKATFMVLATTHRLMWVVVAAVPWVLPEARGGWWQAMLLLLLVNWAVGAASSPAWMSWMADVIPRKVRGRYFGVRNRIGQGVGLLTTLGIGYVLDVAEQAAQGTDGQRIMLRVTSVVLALAGLVGALDIQWFARIRDDYPRPAPPRSAMLEALKAPLADVNFRWFLGFNFTLHLAIGFIGQYVWLYAFDVVGMSNKQANLLIVAIPLLVMMSSYRLWGGLMDRLGRKPVLLGAGILVVSGSAGWILVGPDVAQDLDLTGWWTLEGAGRVAAQLLGADWTWWSRIGYLMVLLTTFAWPGVEVANFNIILDMASPRGGGKGGGAYVALNSVAIAVGGMLSGLLAGFAAGWWLRDMPPLAVPYTPLVLTYHGVLFLASSLARAASLVFIARVHEPKAVGTRAALQFMGQTFYSNVREAFTFPTRLVGQASRWTFLISVPIRRRIRFGGRLPRRWWQLWR